MNSNELESYKQTLKLTKRQREIIVGTILGDGHLETSNNGRTYRLKTEHALSQKAYVDWLYAELKDWVRTKPQIKEQLVNNKMFSKYWFNTYAHGSLRFYGQQFYKQKKKIVPKLIYKWLTPLSLAVWFMDDGSIKSKVHKARIINTQSFTKAEVELLIKTLQDNFGLQSKLRKQPEGYQIMILAESAEKFAQIIGPYLHDSMKYKLEGLG